MLLNLKIRDFAIIDAVEFELQPGFTVITGETGAGKSILVNALTLVLGGRASADLIRSGSQTAEVEALFDISDQPIVRARLEQRELVGDDANVLLVRRVIGAKGRAKVVVNNRLATVATLGEIVRGLVDISGQHEQQSLLVVENHVDILDAFGSHEKLQAAYREAHHALLRASRERDLLKHHEEETLQRADYLRFQVDEIERLAPEAGEDERLAAERARLAHADRLQRGVATAEALLYGEDGSAFDKLSKATAEVEALGHIDTELTSVAQVLDSSRCEVEEAARQLQKYLTRVEADPKRLEWVDDRLDELRRLLRKHGGSLGEVLARQVALREELGNLENADTRLAELDAEIERLDAAALAAAERLSRARHKAAKKLCLAVETEVADMNLEGARFSAAIGSRPPAGGRPRRGADLSATGIDEVEFLWSANQGEPLRPLARIVSGGELSRLMLAVKRVLAARDLVSLYVFDEVDTGLGGSAADAIGRKIQAVANAHQAIAITHLAPIAACAHHHICVRKTISDGRTVSEIANVDGANRAEEIARMIDGANITSATRDAAREMLARSD
jgi:DNA repair protein RecN (Recombination protein N)